MRLKTIDMALEPAPKNLHVEFALCFKACSFNARIVFSMLPLVLESAQTLPAVLKIMLLVTRLSPTTPSVTAMPN